eukprot:2978217-Pleurochrysis_carterae.AAC.1
MLTIDNYVSAAAKAELDTFTFPLTSNEEVKRLLACEHASPTTLHGGEFSGALRDKLFHNHGEIALSVDFRPSEKRGPHYIGDVADVAHLKHWKRAFFWPPCTHQAL